MFALLNMSGPWEWIIILVIVLLVFGAGKLPQVLGQMGKGVKAFKDGMQDDETKSIEDNGDKATQNDAAYVDAEEIRR